MCRYSRWQPRGGGARCRPDRHCSRARPGQLAGRIGRVRAIVVATAISRLPAASDVRSPGQRPGRQPLRQPRTRCARTAIRGGGSPAGARPGSSDKLEPRRSDVGSAAATGSRPSGSRADGRQHLGAPADRRGPARPHGAPPRPVDQSGTPFMDTSDLLVLAKTDESATVPSRTDPADLVDVDWRGHGASQDLAFHRVAGRRAAGHRRNLPDALRQGSGSGGEPSTSFSARIIIDRTGMAQLGGIGFIVGSRVSASSFGVDPGRGQRRRQRRRAREGAEELRPRPGAGTIASTTSVIRVKVERSLSLHPGHPLSLPAPTASTTSAPGRPAHQYARISCATAGRAGVPVVR